MEEEKGHSKDLPDGFFSLNSGEVVLVSSKLKT